MKLTKHFETMTTGNVLAEVLKEIDRAKAQLEAGNSAHATIHLDYVQTIIDDACSQYGANAVFGVMEIETLPKL
jgi:hypothetical protein